MKGVDVPFEGTFQRLGKQNWVVILPNLDISRNFERFGHNRLLDTRFTQGFYPYVVCLDIYEFKSVNSQE
jgi:hypothetical protein